MKIFNFHLMPYRHADLDAIEKNGSAWVTFSNRHYDPQKGAELYHDYLDQMEFADQLGFDGVCLNEHHQTAYGMMPIPGVLAGALARSVKRAKIAILGRALPLLNNPLAVAEETAFAGDVLAARAKVRQHRIDAVLVDRAQRSVGQPQVDPAVLALDPKAATLQVRQEPALGLVVGMGNVVPYHGGFASDLTNSSHRSLHALEFEQPLILLLSC